MAHRGKPNVHSPVSPAGVASTRLFPFGVKGSPLLGSVSPSSVDTEYGGLVLVGTDGSPFHGEQQGVCAEHTTPSSGSRQCEVALDSLECHGIAPVRSSITSRTPQWVSVPADTESLPGLPIGQVANFVKIMMSCRVERDSTHVKRGCRALPMNPLPWLELEK